MISCLKIILKEKKSRRKKFRRVLRRSTLKGDIIPVLCGSSFKNKGVQDLMDAVVDLLPSSLRY